MVQGREVQARSLLCQSACETGTRSLRVSNRSNTNPELVRYGELNERKVGNEIGYVETPLRLRI